MRAGDVFRQIRTTRGRQPAAKPVRSTFATGCRATLRVVGPVVLLTATLGGCYQRVVGTSGLAPSTREVYEPNLEVEKPKKKTGGLTWHKSVTGDPDNVSRPPEIFP